MPRRSKGPRLWLRARNGSRRATWLVKAFGRQFGTGLGIEATEQEKADALAAVLARQYASSANTTKRDPTQILLDDVLLKYMTDLVEGQARPEEVKSRIKILKAFWSGKYLSEVTGDTCRAYAKRRSTPAAARRELEDLRAAINHHRREGLHDKIVSVVLPPKSEPRERWLTFEEAAALIRAAWRYRERQQFHATDRYTRRHVARFMVVARYMGSRAGVICGASLEPNRPAGRPWINLTTGMFYGRPEGQRKTKKRRQMVVVPRPLLAHMRRWRKNGQRYVVEWNRNPVTRIDKAHRSSVADAGLGPEVTPHIWRHTVATWLMQAGADIWEAANFLAMTVETLTRVYGHHHPSHNSSVHAAFQNRRRHRFGNDTKEQIGIDRHRSAP